MKYCSKYLLPESHETISFDVNSRISKLRAPIVLVHDQVVTLQLSDAGLPTKACCRTLGVSARRLLQI
jgi:hypothetical protein